MTNRKEIILKKQIIRIGRQLAGAGFIAARAGNLSVRLSRDTVLITAAGTQLGSLRLSDIVKVNLCDGRVIGSTKRPSSELALHCAIYQQLACNVVLHCHPPLTNAYFAVCKKLPFLTFETQFYLKDVPVVAQKSVNVLDPEPVIRALRTHTVAVLKNHGVCSIARRFPDALHPIQVLEEAVKVAAVARLFNKKALDGVDRSIKKCLRA